jgi:hypothetical protein
MRFTIKSLRSAIEAINDCLEGDGSSIRLEERGRYGYQAVDEYSVDADGNRMGSGVNRNVCCGSSKECACASWEHYYAERRRRDRKG